MQAAKFLTKGKRARLPQPPIISRRALTFPCSSFSPFPVADGRTEANLDDVAQALCVLGTPAASVLGPFLDSEKVSRAPQHAVDFCRAPLQHSVSAACLPAQWPWR